MNTATYGYSLRRPGPVACAWWLAALFAALALWSVGARAAQRTPFDHLTTGWELIGQHRDLPCESCHVNAIFKGTPKDCASCHGVGVTVRATAKPASHILTSNKCEACHTPVGWSPAVNFDHAEVMGSCSSCHNGVQATGKGPNHIVTDREGDVCHSTIGWGGAVFNHQGITDNCVSCHNGTTATGTPANHVPINGAPCESCHANNVFTTFMMTNATALAPPGMVHTAVSAAACASCHEAGLSWVGVPPTVLRPQYLVPGNASSGAHLATGGCGICHASTVSFLGSTSFPPNHIPLPMGASSTCSICHADATNFATYAMGDTRHAVVAGESCLTCHGAGKSFFGVWTTPLKLPPTNLVHINGAPCEGCHSPTNFATFVIPNTSTTAPPGMVHGVVAGAACQSCHAAGVGSTFVQPVKELPAIGSPGGHVATNGADCGSCQIGRASCRERV
jgi:hypothetical protein